MKKDTRERARQRLDERLMPLKNQEGLKVPPRGWLGRSGMR